MMDKLDLESKNVIYVETTVDEIRSFIGDRKGLPEEIETAFDEAQGIVFLKDSAVSYLVVKVKA